MVDLVPVLGRIQRDSGYCGFQAYNLVHHLHEIYCLMISFWRLSAQSMFNKIVLVLHQLKKLIYQLLN